MNLALDRISDDWDKRGRSFTLSLVHDTPKMSHETFP